MDTDEDMLWTPRDSPPAKHYKWIDKHSGFPKEPREFNMLFHDEGRNVISEENVGHVFDALDAVRNIPGYEDMCSESEYIDDLTNKPGCRIIGVTKFWNDTTSLYRKDTNVLRTMSQTTFPDGARVSDDSLFGYPERDDNGLLEFAQAYMIFIYFADTDKAEDFEEDAINVIVDLDNKWKDDPSINLRVEISAYRSFEDE